MKLSTAQDAHYTHSGTASTVARQMAFAGIAIVWLFNGADLPGAITLPPPLMLATLLLALSLSFDLLQYLIATLIWSQFARRIEKKQKHRKEDDRELPASPYLNWPSNFCFWAKMVLLMGAYCILAIFLAARAGLGG